MSFKVMYEILKILLFRDLNVFPVISVCGADAYAGLQIQVSTTPIWPSLLDAVRKVQCLDSLFSVPVESGCSLPSENHYGEKSTLNKIVSGIDQLRQFSDLFYLELKKINWNFLTPNQWTIPDIWKGYWMKVDFIVCDQLDSP